MPKFVVFQSWSNYSFIIYPVTFCLELLEAAVIELFLPNSSAYGLSLASPYGKAKVPIHWLADDQPKSQFIETSGQTCFTQVKTQANVLEGDISDCKASLKKCQETLQRLKSLSPPVDAAAKYRQLEAELSKNLDEIASLRQQMADMQRLLKEEFSLRRSLEQRLSEMEQQDREKQEIIADLHRKLENETLKMTALVQTKVGPARKTLSGLNVH